MGFGSPEVALVLSFGVSSSEVNCADVSFPLDRPYDPNQEVLLGNGWTGVLRWEDDGVAVGNGTLRNSTGASPATSDAACVGTSVVSPSHWPVQCKLGADKVPSRTGRSGKVSADGFG